MCQALHVISSKCLVEEEHQREDQEAQGATDSRVWVFSPHWPWLCFISLGPELGQQEHPAAGVLWARGQQPTSFLTYPGSGVCPEGKHTPIQD